MKTQQAAGRGSSARELAMNVLTKVEQEQAYSNLLLNQMLTKAKLERQEAALATELVYGTIQRLNTIDHYLGRFVSRGLDKLQPWVRSLLRLSFYQLYYLQRIPSHAAVDEAVKLAKRRGHQGIAGMVNGVLRNALRQLDELSPPSSADPVTYISLAHSHPEWLVRRWIEQFGRETAEAICAANNEPPKVSVRANAFRQSRDELLRHMQEQGLAAQASAISPAGIIVEGAGNMAHTAWYESGELSIQDESSMLVADLVDPSPEMNVLDCCAAPGGKTTHIAEKMQNTGTVWANDLHRHKQELIDRQAARLGLTNVRTITGDAAELGQQFPKESFDRILLDAPCSGLGVIRRKPDLKWVKQEHMLHDIAAIQLRLLESVAPLLKRGGILVYSTCTLEYTENEGVVRAFLERHPEYALDETANRFVTGEVGEQAAVGSGMLRILPHQFHSDGFFIARLRKE